MKHKHFNRLLSLLLVVTMLAGLFSLSVSAESLVSSSTVTIQSTGRNEYLSKSTGGSLGGSSWTYTSNDGITGTAYCVNWGLGAVSPFKALTIQEYNRNPPTMGAFANGYPNRTLEQFKGLHQDDVRGIGNLTEDEYKYATQVAVWATCGQLAVAGTAFTAGRASLVEPTADAQQIRIYDSVRAILFQAQGWSKNLYSGIFLRAEEDRDIRGVEVVNDFGLEGAATRNEDGIKKETINGKEYYTRVLYVSSATSTWIDGYTTKVYSNDAPSGTIFAAENNSTLETVQEGGTTRYKVDTSALRDTSLNANGEEYYGAFKVCIPVDNVTSEGSFTVEAYGGVAQYNLYLAYNPSDVEQSYIISDPGYSTAWAQIPITWSTTEDLDETASLQVVKAGAGGSPLEGASFTLTGSGGTTVNGTTGRNGQIIWTDLPADETYTLTETSAPEGYRIIAPMNITLTAGRTAYITVSDDTENTFTVKKIDAQNKASLQGAVFAFEQIDGTYKTTGTTGFDGTVSFKGSKLPYGSYRVYEQSAPQGYQKDNRVETVQWDGSRDVTLTFENVRDIGLTIVKKDADTGVSLPNATFDVYADGEFLTSVTTNDAGEAYVTGIKKEAYIEIVETAAPAGYVLDRTFHGVHIDPYDPAIEDDPVITVTNQARPTLRIIKYDQQSGKRLSGATFEIYKDGALFDTKTTNENGEILLYDLEPGVYLVKEISTDDSHVVNSTPQEIKLEAGQTATQELIFFNSLKPGIHLIKVDSVTMKSLPNVRFEFKLVGGSYRQEFTTDLNGEIDLSKLEPGAYEVRELEAPEGYLVDDAVRVVQINPDETASFVFTNTPKPSLRIIKTSSDGTRLGGVQFRIAKIEDGTHYLDRITDEKGEINISGLEPGVYSVQETGAPSEYILNDTEYHVELFAGQTSTLVLENDAKPDLKIVKTDAVTGEPVQGVTFTLRGADGPTITTEATDARGEILIEDLDPGVYEITEQSVPDDYLLDPIPQKITLVPNKLGVARFQNYPKPTLTIKKIDSATGKPVEGARFRFIYASNHTFTGEVNDLGEYYTDADGLIHLDKLRDGWYQVTEVEAPSGYRIQGSGVQECYLAAGTDKVLTFENVPLSTILIQKMDEETGKPLSGAWFRVRYLNAMTSMDGTTIGEYVTDDMGQIEIRNLDEGTYIIEEISAPAGYVLSSETTRTVYLAGEDQDFISIIYGNQKMGSLLIVKKDSLTGAPLSGVEFFVTDSDGAVVGSGNGKFTTDFAGSILISNLEPGKTIVAKETRTISGYVLDDAPQTVKIKANETVTLEFRNAPKGTLIVQKIDSATGKPLTGAEFKITAANGELAADNEGLTSSNGIYRTDSNGQVVLEKLTPGTYVVTETRAPDGYEFTGQSQTVVVNAGDTQTLNFYNEPLAALTIIKRDADTKEPLPGAAFAVKDGAGNPVGAEKQYVTGSDGTVTVTGLVPNSTVVVSEETPPAGYWNGGGLQTVVVQSGIANSVTFENRRLGTLIIRKFIEGTDNEPLKGVAFRVTVGDGAEVGPDGGVYYTDAKGEIVLNDLQPDITVTAREISTVDGFILDGTPQDIKIIGGQAQQLTFWNAREQTLTVQKYVEGTTTPIEGVVFLITDSSGAVLGANNGEFTTDRNGRIVLTGLTPGTTVTAKEIKTVSGFVLDTTPQSILIKEGEAQTLTFYNVRKGGLELIKVSESDSTRRIPNTTFEIRRMDGGLVDTVTTGKNGRVHIDLNAGDYYAVEIEAAQGFKLDDTPNYFTVKDGRTTTLTVKNRPLSGILIHKTDSTTGEGIYGVTFLLYDANRNPIGQYTSDNKGYVYIEDLPDSGRYYLRELENEGYIVDTQFKTVYVTAGTTTEIQWENTPITGQIQITKTSADYNGMNGWPAGTPIPGAVFEIYHYRTGNLVDTIQTDKNGVASSKPLPLGRYKIVESKAADFYAPDKTPIEVEIEHAGQIVKAAMTNKSLYTNVSIKKTGYAEVMPGQSIRYDLSGIANNSTVSLNSFYWRDTLPADVRLDKIVTGTYNVAGSYKIVYRTNLSGGNYRVLADNLSAARNYVLDASPAALGLAANEYVTEFMVSFGIVPPNFRQVEAPAVYCNVAFWLTGGTQFVNQADVGGVYNGQWIMAASRWVTNVYAPAKPLPRTGY